MPTMKLSDVLKQLAVTMQVQYTNSWPNDPNVSGHYQVVLSEPIYADGRKVYTAKYHSQDTAIRTLCGHLSGRFLETRSTLGLRKRTLDLREESPFNHSDITVVP